MPTRRQEIVTALAARLATIKKSNGYATDAGRRVVEHPDAPFIFDQLPAYSWSDGDTEVNAGAEIGRYEHVMAVEVVAHCSGVDKGALAREMMADVLTSLRSDQTLGGLCQRISLIRHSVDIQQPERKIAFGLVVLNITYRTAHLTL